MEKGPKLPIDRVEIQDESLDATLDSIKVKLFTASRTAVTADGSTSTTKRVGVEIELARKNKPAKTKRGLNLKAIGLMGLLVAATPFWHYLPTELREPMARTIGMIVKSLTG